MYIRTKDGRIAEVKENMAIKRCSENVLRLVYKDNQSICVLNGNDDIIKQSENLEELCDGFYIDEGNEFSFYEENAYEDFEEAKKDFLTNFDQTSTLYAFIKTDKGLIYVAKMNESGDLELIWVK